MTKILAQHYCLVQNIADAIEIKRSAVAADI